MIDSKPLPDDAGAKAPEAVGVGEVDVAPFVQLSALRVREETGGERRCVFGRQFRRVRPDRLQISVKSPERRRIHAEMNVGSTTFLADGQIVIDVRRGGSGRGGGGNFG